MAPEGILDDVTAMRAALDLAARGPLVDPNPRVGCVLVNPEGVIVGQGWHQGAGTAHAEAMALAQAGSAAAGATAYVTLEPCAHVGRTPPCTQALLAAGVRRVVAAVLDPTPVAGGGLATLAAAGVEVSHGLLAEPAGDLIHHWYAAAVAGRPYLTWKVAASLDGRVAAPDGTSRWITGPAAREQVHHLRASVGAIIVGTGTARIDDPALTVRGEAALGLRQRADGARQQPLRVVVGLSGLDGLASQARLRDDSAHTLALRTRDPHEVLRVLGERGIRHALFEGGPRLAGAFVAAGLVDEVHAYLAPVLLGAGPAALTGTGLSTLSEETTLRLVDTTTVGSDVRITLRRNDLPTPHSHREVRHS